MGTKMHRGSKRAALIGAAALPAIAGLSASLMSSSSADAAITFTVTNQGVTHNDIGQTVTGWSSYLLTINADPGNVITAVDFGQDTNSTGGIFGPMLQNYGAGKGAGTPTPVEAATNGGDYGIDSHVVVVTGRVDVTSPFENTDSVNPGPPVPANDTSDKYGTGSFLRGVFGIQGANQVQNQNLAYIVLKDGTQANFKLSAAESVGGSFNLTGTIGTTSGGSTATPIVSLTAAAPAGFGNKLTNGAGVDKATFNPNAPVADSINVTGSNSSYVPGFANNVNGGAGQNKFYVQASGFNPASDQEVYGLDLKHTTGGADTTPAEEVTIANEINAAGGKTGIALNAVSAANAPANLQALFPTYDIFLLTTASPATNSAFLGLDFSQETGVGGISVANVAAVPEPASAAGILLGATGLLLGRRKRQA